MVSYCIAKNDNDDRDSPPRFDVLDIAIIGEFTFSAYIEVKCKTLKCAFDHFLSAYKFARANNAIPKSIADWCDSFFALDFHEYYDGLELESISTSTAASITSAFMTLSSRATSLPSSATILPNRLNQVKPSALKLTPPNVKLLNERRAI